jgi:hypothetical protein
VRDETLKSMLFSLLWLLQRRHRVVEDTFEGFGAVLFSLFLLITFWLRFFAVCWLAFCEWTVGNTVFEIFISYLLDCHSLLCFLLLYSISFLIYWQKRKALLCGVWCLVGALCVWHRLGVGILLYFSFGDCDIEGKGRLIVFRGIGGVLIHVNELWPIIIKQYQN